MYTKMIQVPYLLVSDLKSAPMWVLSPQAGHVAFVLECGSDRQLADKLAGPGRRAA